MNLSLHDPFTLAQDYPDKLISDIRSGHATTLRFSRKGDYLASGRLEGKIVIWDMETMGVAMKLRGHWKQIQSLSWSRDGRYLLSASQDCRVCLWDLKTQERIRTVKFEAAVYLAEIHPHNHNLLVCSLLEDHPFLVDMTNPVPIKHTLPSQPLDVERDIKSLTMVTIFSINGNHIIAGTSKGYINIIETATRKIIHSTKLTPGLITLLRLTPNGRQLLVNSTDRAIRVVEMPDLSIIRPIDSIPDLEHQQTNDIDEHDLDADPDHPSNGVNPATLPENIHLQITNKFHDLVNRQQWNDCAFSHTSFSTTSTLTPMTPNTSTTADYVTASTYMKRDIYIWELRTNSLLKILDNLEEPAIIEWHPTKPLIACTSLDTGSIQIFGIEAAQKWSALAPDFTEVTENVEYVERENEFDSLPAELIAEERLQAEDEKVDVLTIGDDLAATHHANDFETENEGAKQYKDHEATFTLPILYDIDDSDADDQELVRLGVGTMRKKDVNEGKDYEDEGESTPNASRVTDGIHASGGNGKKGRRK